MVGWSDFLASSPGAEFWHFGIGLAAILIAVRLLKVNVLWSAIAFFGFVIFVLFKELVIDTSTGCVGSSLCGEGASVTSGVVDATWFFIGGVAGAGLGLLPVRAWWLAPLATIAILLVLAGLWMGVV